MKERELAKACNFRFNGHAHFGPVLPFRVVGRQINRISHFCALHAEMLRRTKFTDSTMPAYLPSAVYNLAVISLRSWGPS